MILGDKNLALTLCTACFATAHQIKASGKARIGRIGEIIPSKCRGHYLITGMGGAFGGILQQTSLGLEVSAFVSSQNFGSLVILVVAYFTTSVIRIAQGSATVAMVTSIGIVGGLVEQGIGIHPVYLALAIGCGAKPIHG